MILKKIITRIFKKRLFFSKEQKNSLTLSPPTATPDQPHQTLSTEKTITDKYKKKSRRSPHKKLTEKQKPKSIQEKTWALDQFQVLSIEGKTRFHDLNLALPLMHGIAEANYQYCTPIQSEILKNTLSGTDAIGRAQTGTGKTAAFLVTILNHIENTQRTNQQADKAPRALILAPTRELVLQIVKDAEALGKYCKSNVLGIIGGTDYQKQINKLSRNNIDIVAATPGRLLDLIRKRFINLNQVETLVIDEADRMLDMGFIPDVRSIVHKTPHKDKRQTLFFSATLTPEVTRLASQWTKNSVIVDIEPDQIVTDTVRQVVYLVTSELKFALLYNLIVRQNLNRILIFCNRRDETRYLTDMLRRYDINCALISGEIPQNTRIRTLENFRNGKTNVLVATDVAGRGIHIDNVTHVINYTLPYEPENYVHRIGRTGRAGISGTSISFADEMDSFSFPEIEDFIGEKLNCIHPDEDWLELPPAPKSKPKPKKRIRKYPQKRNKNRPSHNQKS